MAVICALCALIDIAAIVPCVAVVADLGLRVVSLQRGVDATDQRVWDAAEVKDQRVRMGTRSESQGQVAQETFTPH